MRLDPSETKKLATMAKRAKVSRSRVLASLVERALDQLVIEQSTQAEPSTRRASTERHSKPASIPGPKAYKTWAGLIRRIAHDMLEALGHLHDNDPSPNPHTDPLETLHWAIDALARAGP